MISRNPFARCTFEHTRTSPRPQRMSSRPEEILALESSGEVMVVVLARRRRDTGTFLPPAMMQQNGFWDLQGCVVDIYALVSIGNNCVDLGFSVEGVSS